MAACEIKSQKWINPPNETAHGALLQHITRNAFSTSFQPMNINFGLFPNINMKKNKKLNTFEKKIFRTKNAKFKLEKWISNMK